jgi:glycosyltransferase involved in cell wall biosynthesis
MSRKKVALLCAYLPQYRLPFVAALYEKCRQSGIDLEVIYGNPTENNELRADRSDFAPGHFAPSRFITCGPFTAIWQPVLPLLSDAELVISDFQSKLILNYILILQQSIGRKKIAFFGHVRNHQAKRNKTIAHLLKRSMACLPYWWFAYTPGEAEYLVRLGFPETRITVFYNAVDTTRLRQWRSEISKAEIGELRRQLNLTSDNVCIYIGSMYPDKRMAFLIEACRRIRGLIPDFSMLFIGTGPDAAIVKRFCEEESWASYLGPLFEREKVKVCMLARLLLMPGAVGLAILDAFAMRMPIVTTEFRFHGPEIDYLEDGSNGIIVAPATDIDRYASAVAELLINREKLANIAESCEYSASRLTIENMADHCLDGILRALMVG